MRNSFIACFINRSSPLRVHLTTFTAYTCPSALLVPRNIVLPAPVPMTSTSLKPSSIDRKFSSLLHLLPLRPVRMRYDDSLKPP